MAGYIKLHRKLLKWEWYSDPNTFRVFMHLLLTASYEENSFRGHELKAGQVVCGRKQLAKDLGLSERSVRTALEHLKSTNEITIKTTNRFSIITIEKWAMYQSDTDDTDQQTDQQADTQATNNRPATDHTQEVKKLRNKEIKKDIYSRERVEIVNYLNEICGTQYRPHTKKTKELIHARLSEGFTVEDFKTVIYRKAKQWIDNPKMCKFLRPETLFSNKFEGYLNEKAPLSATERWDIA